MFKSKKGSNLSTSKLPSNDCVSKNAISLHNDESNISTSSKKSKKKTFFNSIKNKINSVLEGKNKSAAGHTHTKTSRSKSFEVLSNSFEDSNERTSSSEDPILERGKWGSKRSQSIRNKHSVCPVEFAASQVASNSTRAGFQIEGNETDRVTNNTYREVENIHWTNSFVNSSSVGTSCSGGPHTVSFGEPSPSSQSDKDTHHETKEKDKRENTTINQNNIIQNSPLANSSHHKEITTIRYKDIENSTSPCKINTSLCKGLEVSASSSCLGIDDGEFKSLAREIRELSKYGWYWGPLNRNEAEDKLLDQPDGAFLVRDSSDVKYLLSLSFRSYGKTLHTRIEHSNGLFSFYPQPDHDSHRSLVGLINHCITESDGGVFCYSRPLIKGSPSFPVRLTKPVSRFMQVRSLQYLCRFVIRQYTSINHIQNLPIPPKIQGYLKESYY